MLWTLVTLASASSGPWVSGSGVLNVYIGIDGEQYERVGFRDPANQRQSVRIGEGVQSIGVGTQLSYGIAPRMEAELSVPWRATHVNREDADLCANLGDDSCEATHTIGVIEARIKGVVLDEISGAPFSVSLAGEVRYGGLTATTRHRLTNAGEGTTDLGPGLAIGRSGAVGEQGYYAVALDLGWRYRVPNTRSFPRQQGNRAVPGSEFHGNLEALFTARGLFSFGPFAQALYRPGGVDFDELVPEDPDRFAALRIVDTRAGGKLLIRDARDHVFVVAVSRTVYARNNPADSLAVSFGISLNDVLRRREVVP